MKKFRRRHKKGLAEHYENVQERSKRHLQARPYILPIAGFLLGLAVVGTVVLAHGGQTIKPSDSHVVFLFDKGKEQTLDTKATTVGDLIKKLPLHLIKQDVVEPALDTQIVEDNFRVNVYRARPVTVVDDGGRRSITLTAQRSPRVVAQDAGLTVYAEDKPGFAQGSLKENILGEKVVIKRATPVLLNLYGTSLTVRTHSKTIGDLLKEKRLKLAGGDKVQPDIKTPITPNMQVFITRDGVKIASVEEAIPAPTQVIQDASLSLGASVVRQAGVPGKKVVTYQIQTQNGKEVGRIIIQQAVVQGPVTQIIARGSTVNVNGDKGSLMSAAGIAGSQQGYANFVISHESNWNPGAVNGGGCAGLGQACPGSKLAAACPGWQNNPVCQLRFFSGYANGRYGSWGGAYNYWLSHHYW